LTLARQARLHELERKTTVRRVKPPRGESASEDGSGPEDGGEQSRILSARI
jgi:hypothetical protein